MAFFSFLDLQPQFEKARQELKRKGDVPAVWEWSTKTQDVTIRYSKNSKGQYIDQTAPFGLQAPGGVWAAYRGNFQPCADPGFSINGVRVIIDDTLPEDTIVLRGTHESVILKIVESPH